MKHTAVSGLLLVLCLAHPMAQNSTQKYVVEQKDKTFVYKGAKATTLRIKVGSTVEFKNLDPYFHNVFSLSDAKLFDLGSYPQGESRSVTFDKAGSVEVECAIHPAMKMTIEVK